MTEQERLKRISKGKLWNDTDEYLAHQAKVKDLMYDFNMSKPSETEKRAGLIQKMFGRVGKDVWINQPLTLAVGSTVTIGDGTYINSGMTFIDDYKITIGNVVFLERMLRSVQPVIRLILRNVPREVCIPFLL